MSGGKKNDEEKPQLSYIPYCALTETAQAFSFGAKKYGKFNYKKGIEFLRLLDAAMRHLEQFKEGQDFDEESKTVLHLGHAMANISMLIDMYYNNPKMDDRYKNESSSK